MLRFQNAWKAYFYLALLASVLGIGGDIREQFQNPTLIGAVVTVIAYVVTVVGLVGLHGFVWQQRIWKAPFWKIFFFINILLMIAAVIFGLVTEPALERAPLGDIFLFLSILVAVGAPHFIALFLYAFRNERVWKIAS